MRALLVVNPKATLTTSRVRDVIARALGSELKLDVAETRRRGHATELGRQATADEMDVVVVLGGDGTVNEVINGLLAGHDDESDTHRAPLLAVVPGGSTNVFTRSLGLPRDPIEATAEILSALRDGRHRTIGLGRVDERWFTFCAGLGLDAEVVRGVEGARRRGRRATPTLYVATTFQHFLTATDRRHPALTIEIPGEEPIPHIYLAIVSNTAPWTYLGRWQVNTSPDASFDTGLDLMAMRRLGLFGTLHTAAGLLSQKKPGPRGRSPISRHDLSEFRIRSDRPIALQVDGDYVGEREAVSLRCVPRALRVVAAAPPEDVR